MEKKLGWAGEDGHNFCTFTGLYSRLLQDKMAKCWAKAVVNNEQCGSGIVWLTFLVSYLNKPDADDF